MILLECYTRFSLYHWIFANIQDKKAGGELYEPPIPESILFSQFSGTGRRYVDDTAIAFGARIIDHSKHSASLPEFFESANVNIYHSMQYCTIDRPPYLCETAKKEDSAYGDHYFRHHGVHRNHSVDWFHLLLEEKSHHYPSPHSWRLNFWHKAQAYLTPCRVYVSPESKR